ncbi:uncharacterized protein EI97DRAFT_490886 [Westerdykella ornata]|uniref:Ubiquitin-like domain-containing protein n=1 Tax=Westerdykella ornata TaxID=318751 RepID=A0A6A6JWD2_WESOR|nr:uncharacterized protein EI97DRAFT_490886 [Westerdykella ornata]KAF2280717.1 hypothetical protein EI97DRAFT_490886 [Westerdykella ornata]
MTEPENPEPPKRKRFAFKKAEWQAKKEDDDHRDMFSHSNEFRDIIAEENRRKQEAKRKKEEEKKRKEEEKREKKRAKLSLEREEGQGPGNASLEDHKERRTKSRTPVSPYRAKNNSSLSTQYDALTEIRKPSATIPSTSEIIDLGSLSSSEDLDNKDTKSTMTPPSTAPVKNEEDDVEEVVDVELQNMIRQRQATRLDSIPKRDPLDDKIVQLLITSEIPGSAPLITTVKTGHPIGRARTAWCVYNRYSDEQTQNIFFTWKHKKLVDSTTIKRLGIKLDPSGAITVDGTAEIYDDENLPKIHVEAWTDELFAQWKAGEELKKRKPETQPPIEEPEPVQPEPAKANIRLKLKSKEYPLFKIAVRPDTTIEHLASAFREYNKIPSSQPITLMFDGERLRPMDTIENTDVEDMESIEVHLK